MNAQDKLTFDEMSRMAQLEAVKNEARNEVRAEVSRHAGELAPEEREQAAIIGEQLKQEAIAEVVRTEKDLKQTRVITRVLQFVDFGFYLVYWLIGMEFLLELLGARESNGFRQFIHVLSEPFVGPFRRLLIEPGVGPFQLRISYLVALLVFVLLHWVVRRTVELVALSNRSAP